MVNDNQNIPHVPVMLKEVIETFAPGDGKIYVDATFGAGGYSRALLNCADCVVYAVDCDDIVEQFAETMAEQFKNRFFFILGSYGSIDSLCKSIGLHECDGIVFDIGLSSMQIADVTRGFSFKQDADLDMRMSRSRSDFNAAVFVNTLSQEKIAHIIRSYGEERNAKKISSAIVTYRAKKLITSSAELADIIRKTVPHRNKQNIDAATRTFQAIRIFVNEELEQLRSGIHSAVKLLKVGGKLIVVSFHSLEHRIVKEVFDCYCGIKKINRHSIEVLQDNHNDEGIQFDCFTRRLRPTQSEIDLNPRSRSAYLRAIIRKR